MTQNEKLDGIMLKLTYAALFVLAAGIFTSVSFTALSHILLLVPGFYFLNKSLKDNDFKIKKSFWFLLAFTVTCWLSVLFNLDIINDPIKRVFKTKYFFIGLLSTFAFHHLKKDYLTDKRKAFLLKTFLLATSLATVSGIIGLYTGFNPLKFKASCHATRACGLYGMYMTYGYGISMITVLLAGAALERKRLQHLIPSWMIFTALGINLAGAILSYARGGWLAILFSIPFLFFKSHKKLFLSILVGGSILLGLLIAFNTKVNNVFLHRTGSNTQRIALYKATIKAWQEKPVFGYGYKNFEPNSVKLKKKYNLEHADHMGHAHSNYFEALATTGTVGFVAFIMFCLFWLKESYKEPALFAFVISFLVSGLFQYTFGDGENTFLFMAVFALF